MVESERKLDELAEELHRVLSRLSLVQRRGDTGRAATGDLSPAQLSILYVLRGQGPIRMAELAAHEWVRAPTITMAIRRLETFGLVQRSGDVCDKRAVLWTLRHGVWPCSASRCLASSPAFSSHNANPAHS
jgi:DNA-binding MarR family transcriptional regulator